MSSLRHRRKRLGTSNELERSDIQSATVMLLVASLVVNVLVLLPVTLGLARDAPWVRAAYGPREPGRQILLAIYLAILVLSGALLYWREPRVAMGLLLAQVIYKVLTPLTVRTLRNPVVISNLLIAALHVTTIATLR